VASVVPELARFTMEAMLSVPDVGELGVSKSRGGIWDNICLAYPVLTSNVGAIYMAIE
jgi:hypothetical protein